MAEIDLELVRGEPAPLEQQMPAEGAATPGPSPGPTHVGRLWVDRLRRGVLLAVGAAGPLLVVRVGSGTPLGAIDLLAPLAIFLVALSRRSWSTYRGVFLLYVGWLILSAFLRSLVVADVAMDSVLAKVIRLLAITSPLFLAGALQHGVRRVEELVIRLAVVTTTAGVVAGLVLHQLGMTPVDTQRVFFGTEGAVRAGGLVGNTGSYGLLVAVAFLLGQFSGADALPLPATFWRPLNAAVCLAAFIASSSRGALVAVAAAILLVAVRHIRRLLVAVGLLTGVVPVTQLVAGGSAFVMASLVRIDVFNQTGQSSFTDSVRMEYWSRSLQVIGDNIFVGVGFKQFYIVEGYYLDNAYLLAIAESGLVGLGLLVAFMAKLIKRAHQLEANSRLVGDPLATMLVVALGARMLTGGANSDWYVTPLIFAVVGLRLRSEELNWSKRNAPAS